ncbi:MAG TPA: ATP synthase F1 subunit delta [Trichormus sp.]|jgi:F-type H+-transporting ATPase subunit delta
MKSELSMVAAQYAEAVLDLAYKEGGEAQADQVLADIHGVNEVNAGYPPFAVILDHPSITTEEKRSMIVKTFSGKVTDLTLRLLELLLDKRRLHLLKLIETQFHELLNQRKNILGATLTCADPLSDKAIADIKSRLTEHLGRRLELAVDVDPSLLGGMVLRLGDQVLDGSIKGKLRNLERALLSV